MCGLTGCWTKKADVTLHASVQTMSATLNHRGPDAAAIWVDESHGIGLGHRRLKVIDLSENGAQPMHSACNRYVLVFNGEIYNHHRLRAELEECGLAPIWRGHSDTEVVLAAISSWGIEHAISKLIGMFAMAVWDCLEKKLHLARDRVGEKPLYYGWCNSAFLFGSELKALKKYPNFSNEINRQALTLYLRHMVIPAPLSIYRGIYKLQPGCLLTLGLDEASMRTDELVLQAPFSYKSLHLRQYWSLHEVAELGQTSLITDEKEALQLLETKLRESIKMQSIADVPTGAFLSGGIDSSLITALMQSEAKSPIRTFTIGFDEKRYDEAKYASAVAKHLGTEHIQLYVNAKDALDVIPRLPRLYDEPFADSSQIPTFLLCVKAREYLTVALSGDAGDELFGGYNRYFWVRKIWNKVSWLPTSTRRLFTKAILSLPTHYWDAIYSITSRILNSSERLAFTGQKLHNLAERMANIDNEDDLFYSLISEWKHPENIVMNATEPATILTERNKWPSLPDIEHRMMHLDTMTYLPNDIMVKVDRAAMGASLETRAPFLDHRVVSLAWRLPLGMKLRNNQGKWALRQLLYKYVPQELIERPKQGFSIPLGDWLRGPLQDWAEDLLSEERLRKEEYFYPAPIRTKWQEHLSGIRNWENSLWTILMFQLWLQEQRS